MKPRANVGALPVERREEWNTTDYGTFARIHDPEGLALELWEPPVAQA